MKLIRWVLLSSVLGMSALAYAGTTASCECPSCECDRSCDCGR